MKASLVGRWRITHMEQWDQDFVEAEEPGFIELDPNGGGEFHFGYVHGQMTCEFTERDGRPAVEWSWEGNDEMDPATGRGWAVLQDDGTLKGKLFFHSGDSSALTAERSPARKGKSGRSGQATKLKRGEIVKVPIEKIKPGPIRHPNPPEPLLKRIRAIHAQSKDFVPQTLEQCELDFMRDAHPEAEVAIWERVVAGVAKASAALPKLDRKAIFRVVLGHSAGALTPEERAKPDVARIIEIVEGE